MVRSKTGGGPGTNQYQTRGVTSSQILPNFKPGFNRGDSGLPRVVEEKIFSADCPAWWLASKVDNRMLAPLIAKHPNATPDIWMAIADGQDTNAQFALLTGRKRFGQGDFEQSHKPDLPVEVLRVLSRNGDPEIAGLAMAALPLDALPVQYLSIRELDALLLRADCPVDVIRQAAADQKYAAVATHVAALRHRNCPADVISTDSTNWHPDIQAAVAASPHCPVEALIAFARYGSYALRAVCAGNPACPADVQRDLLVHDQLHPALAANPGLDPHCAVALLDSPHPEVRTKVLSNPAMPEHIRAIGALGR